MGDSAMWGKYMRNHIPVVAMAVNSFKKNI